jgi:hypothetical protein
VNLILGGLIEIADYNELALEINRIFSDTTTSLVWSTSDIVLDDVADGAGEAANATRTLSPSPLATDFLSISVDGMTLDVDVDYTIVYGVTVEITYLDALPANAILKAWNRTAHRYGWGQQASVHPITVGQTILADEATLQAYLEANVNNLIDKVNIMEVHTGGPSALTRVALGGLIYATDKTLITSTIEADITIGTNYWLNDLATVFADELVFTRTYDWNNVLTGETRHYWENYDAFRYFFNSGNELRGHLSMTGDPTNQGYVNWNQVCTLMGTLSINYDTSFQSGSNGVSSGLGAYDLTTEWQTVFTSGSPKFPVNDVGEYDGPPGSEYDEYGVYADLIIMWDARIVENVPNTGNIALELRTTMRDASLNVTTVGTTTYRGSYLLADDIIDNSATFSQTVNVPTFVVTNSFNSTDTMAITNITQASPAVVTVVDTSLLTDGTIITISGVIGMTQVNDLEFTISIVNATTFHLVSVNSTGYTAYTSGGTITYPVSNT